MRMGKRLRIPFALAIKIPAILILAVLFMRSNRLKKGIFKKIEIFMILMFLRNLSLEIKEIKKMRGLSRNTKRFAHKKRGILGLS
jgi:hypothetical protein